MLTSNFEQYVIDINTIKKAWFLFSFIEIYTIELYYFLDTYASKRGLNIQSAVLIGFAWIVNVCNLQSKLLHLRNVM